MVATTLAIAFFHRSRARRERFLRSVSSMVGIDMPLDDVNVEADNTPIAVVVAEVVPGITVTLVVDTWASLAVIPIADEL